MANNSIARGFTSINTVVDRKSFLGAMLAVVFVFPSFIWIKSDRRIWPWDQAWYGEVTADLYYTLISHPSGWFEAMRSMLPSKPPLFSWLGQLFVPLGIAIGDIDFALLLMVVLTQAATLWITGLSARKITAGSDWLALTAMLIIGSAPLFVGMSQQYLVEATQTLVVASSIYLALAAPRLHVSRLFILLALVATLGFAVKTTTIAYCGLFWAIAFAIAIRGLARRRSIEFRANGDLVLLAVLIGTATLTAAWYAKNAADMIAHVHDSTSNEKAELYGHHGTLLIKLGFWIPTANNAFFIYPYIFIGCIVVIALASIAAMVQAKRRFDESKSPVTVSTAVAIAAVVHVVAVIFLLAAQINEESRFLLPLLPPLTIAVVWALSTLGSRRLGIPVSALALAQLICVHMIAHGYSTRLPSSPWLLTVKPNVDERTVAAAIERQTCPPALEYRYNIIGVEFPSMNANSMGYESAKARIARGYRCYYTSLGYAETNVDRAIDRMNSMKISYIILPREDMLPTDTNDVLNAITRPIFDFVSHSDQYTRVTGDFGNYQIWHRAD